MVESERSQEGSCWSELPDHIRRLFWDCKADELLWQQHFEFIIGRILLRGTWEDVSWLRVRVGDDRIKTWFEKTRGQDLEPRQIRFWQNVLSIPESTVTTWLSSPERAIWDRRAGS